LFCANKYVGVDLSEGPNVDEVCSGHEFKSDIKFDICISCESFEHNPYYIETFDNMVNHLNDDGLLIFTCATSGRPEHGTSRTTPELSPGTIAVNWDYYKNLNSNDFAGSVGLNSLTYFSFFVNEVSHDLYFIGTKSELVAKRLKLVEEELKVEVEAFESLSKVLEKVTFDALCDKSLFSPLALYYIYNSKTHSRYDEPLINAVRKSKKMFLDDPYLLFLEANLNRDEEVYHELVLLLKAVELEPSNTNFLFSLSETLDNLQKWDFGIKILEESNITLTKAPLSWKLCDFYYKTKRYDNGLRYANQALTVFPLNTGIINCKIKCEVALRKYSDAAETARFVLEQSSFADWLRNYCKQVLETYSSSR